MSTELEMLLKFAEQATLGLMGWVLFYFAVRQWVKKQEEHEDYLDTEIKELKQKLESESDDK